jgi:hypothetical protein
VLKLKLQERFDSLQMGSLLDLHVSVRTDGILSCGFSLEPRRGPLGSGIISVCLSQTEFLRTTFVEHWKTLMQA